MQRILRVIDRVENITLVWTILILAIIGFVQVITRYLFNYSFTWYEELGRYLGVFIAFLGAGIGVKTSSHFAMDLVVGKIKGPIRGLIIFATHTLATAFFFTVAWYSMKIITRMYGYGTTSPTMEIPMFIAYLPIPVFSVVIGVRFFIKAAVHVFSRDAEAGEKVAG